VNKIIYILTVLFLFSACEGDLDLKPISSVSSSNFYNNKTECELALAGVYHTLGNQMVYGKTLGITAAYGTDEALYARENLNWPLSTYVFNPSSKQVEGVWMYLYRGINNANLLLESLPGAEFKSEEERAYFDAQARFLRAFFYFELVKRWGNVPLRKHSVESLDRANNIALSPAVDTYQFIIDELEAIAPNLPMPKSSTIGKATQTACWGLLARIYLTRAGFPLKHLPEESYAMVERYANLIIESGVHSLNPDYKTVFLQEIMGIHDFREIIFEIQFENIASEGLREGGAYGSANGIQTLMSKGPYAGGFSYAALPLVNLYDQDMDSRYAWNIANWKVNKKGQVASISETYRYYPGKYRRVDHVDGQLIWLEQGNISKNETGADFPVIRYSDILLMKAEALNELGRGAEALPFLNQVRLRAGLAEIDGSVVAGLESLRDELKNERSRELCFEGIRKYDLIRWGDLGNSLNELDQQMVAADIPDNYQWLFNAPRNFEEKHTVWPIPLIEMEENTLIKQHELWR